MNFEQRHPDLAASKNELFAHKEYFDVAEYAPDPYFSTSHGSLFHNDCMEILPWIKDDVIDTVFADPPFNLKKEYGPKSNDNLSESDYVEWCENWLSECVRILKPGGSIYIYNIPKWNILIGAKLISWGLEFRHSIAIEVKNTLPLPKRLYPSHYSLLYFTKGKPKTFRKIRTPIEKCRHCGGEIKDYGGHRNAMNPKGVNLKDVWTDIPPVRHWKFKSQKRKANALSTKILDRVVEMSTYPGDIVLDPFGGSGTTYAVCEEKHRRWIGVEIDFADVIRERILTQNVSKHRNDDFIED